MPNDHIAVSRFIEKEFSDGNLTFCYDLNRNKRYKSSIDTLGTIHDYFDPKVEKELADNYENKMALVTKQLLKEVELFRVKDEDNTVQNLQNIINSNSALIKDFVRILFFRSEKRYKEMNEELRLINKPQFKSLSELLEMEMKPNFKESLLTFLGQDIQIMPTVNLSNRLYINNSIGYSIHLTKNYVYQALFLPLSPTFGLSFNKPSFSNYNDFFITNETQKVDDLNFFSILTEHNEGRGFVFGKREEEIQLVISRFMKELHQK